MSEIQNHTSNRKFKQDNLIYLINEEIKTASIFDGKSVNGDLIIQRSINIDSKEYIITNISKNAFETSNIKSIQFSADSDLRSIDDKAFYKSSIESLTIPPKLTNIGQYCFYFCQKLQKVEIPSNSSLKSI